jgi:hypothetical protein
MTLSSSLAGFPAFGEGEFRVYSHARGPVCRHSGMREAQTRNLEIPGSLVITSAPE